MNKLSFISSIPSNKDTYIYVLPTNSQKILNLDEVSIKVHILDLRGNSLLVFPAADASSDGVCFTLSNLANLGSGTYAIYLELLYAHHQEFYPNDSVKYITIKDDGSGNLTFVNMFTAESSSIVPPQDTKSDLTDVLHVHDIDLKSIITNTLTFGHPANVSLDQNDNLIFDIPSGPKGDKGDTGPQGPIGPQGPKGDTGESAYQAWLDAGNTGSESQFLASLKGLKGDKGDTGPQGPQGIQGIQGPVGPVGPQGPKGDTGPQGPKGDKGDKGDTGTVDNAGLINSQAFQSLQAQVNNSAVGTNLLTNTGDLSANWTGYTSISTTAEYNGHPSMAFAPSTQPQLANQNLGLGDLQNSTQYTASFWAKADNAGDKAHTELWGSNGATDFVLTTNWARYTAVLTSFSDANTNTGHSVCYFGVPAGNKGNVYIAEPKLEKGSVATDWCLNPSEILTKGSRGNNFWAMKMAVGGNVSGRNITDLYNASATNLPEVNDLVVQPDGNVYQVTGVSGSTFNLGSALFSISPSEDDILAKTKQYADDAIENGKW